MTTDKDPNSKHYFFIDIDLLNRKIVGWGTESRGQVEVDLTNGCHRVFTSKGQYNKLVAKLEATRS